MSQKPQFSYHLGSATNTISLSSRVWDKPLPLTRSPLNRQPSPKPGFSPTHGDYFLAARAFLERNDFERFTKAVAQSRGHATKPQDIEVIRIILVKHGEFYHPALIEAVVHSKPVLFVLNLAISQVGQDHIKKEYQTLQMLARKYSITYIPRVYTYAEIASRGGRIIPMFLGQWLKGFHEFHIAGNPPDSSGHIKVWDPDRGNFFLTRRQMLDLYTRAAAILTYYYDLESFQQIFPWHHAAGDFVVKVKSSSVAVFLVSARRYSPLFRSNHQTAAGGIGPEQILQGLLIFLISLSIRMRLDRLDGVGDIVWSDETAVLGAVNGFFQVLASKPPIASLPAPADICFKTYLSSCSKQDLVELADAIVGTFDPAMPEVPLIQSRLGAHIDTLYPAIARIVKEYTI